MDQTTFLMNDDQRPNATPVHVKGEDGAWAGLCNTQFWIDRTTGICASIYSNFLPSVTPEAVQLYSDFEKALYAAL